MSAGCSPAAWTARSAGWWIPCSPRCWGTPVLRDCAVLAIEGTHASGKTTLTHALAAYYRERGIHVACVEEPARHSPFIEEIVVHGKGRFDLECEADLFAAQLSAQLRAARQHTMIICDKTIANVLAYAWLVLPAADRVVRSMCATVGQRVTNIPPNMSTADTVQWIAARVTRLGLTAGA